MKIKLSTLKRMIREAAPDADREWDSKVFTWADDSGRGRSARSDRGAFTDNPAPTRAGQYKQSRASDEYQGYSPEIDDPDFAEDLSGLDDLDQQDQDTYAASFDDDAGDHPDIGISIRSADQAHRYKA